MDKEVGADPDLAMVLDQVLVQVGPMVEAMEVVAVAVAAPVVEVEKARVRDLVMVLVVDPDMGVVLEVSTKH